MSNFKGFLQDFQGNKMLPITRAELVLDSNGNVALTSALFEAGKDGGNQYGLISATDLAALKAVTGGTTGGQNLGDIYTKLQAINASLKVGEISLPFYTESGNTVTTNNIQFVGQNGIKLYADGSNIVVELNELTPSPASITNQIITSITVDKYGRVTDVAGSNTLSSITLQNSKVSTEFGQNEDALAIAYKGYVDAKYDEVAAIATGSLKFNTVIQSKDQLSELCKNINNSIDNYYKIGFTGGSINSDYMLEEREQTLKLGDTIIVTKDTSGNGKFVHIPSGDEPITQIQVKGPTTTGNSYSTGNITIQFADPFIVDEQSGKSIISLPTLGTASNPSLGLLSKTDYDKFQTYAAKSMSYTPTIVNTSPDKYEIGKISLGDNASQTIYGQNTTYELGVIDGYSIGNNQANDPKIQFTPSSGDATIVQIKGSAGVVTTHDGNVINVKANITSSNTSYITVTEGYMIAPVMGEVKANGEITNGLIDFTTAVSYINGVHQSAAHFESITGSLQYGSDDLKAAISF